MRDRISVRDGIHVRVRNGIRVERAMGSESATDSDAGGKGKSSIPSSSTLAHRGPQLPPATSPLWVNLGTKLSTTHRHTQHQSSHPTLGEGTTGTRPWSGLEVAGRGGGGSRFATT